MHRVLIVTAITVLLAGCSLGTQPMPFGFASTSGASTPTPLASRLGDEPIAAPRSSGGTRVASLDTSREAPPVDARSAKAPKGALADRDYAATTLDAVAARDMINAYRRQHGLKPVTLNADLTKAAKAHARDLAKWDRISHYGSDGSNPWDRVKRAGYSARVAAENVGTGQVTFAEVFAGWKASTGHNKNLLLADGQNIGIALVHEPKTEFKTFWTLVIASPL
ncbi:MAG: CAP domain-containing protein [Hyphomicrobiaceae bacterium]